jgi:hypothetical protein
MSHEHPSVVAALHKTLRNQALRAIGHSAVEQALPDPAEVVVPDYPDFIIDDTEAS